MAGGKLLDWAICLIILSIVLVCAGEFSSCIAAEPKQKDAGLSEYVIGVGDVLEVSVWNEPEISKSVFVRLDGKISLPLIGDVFARGASPEALARQISGALSKLVSEPSVTVTLTDSRSKIYYVLGQIIKPGEYRLNTPVTILQAIARAGGFGEWAKKEKIMIVRRSHDQDQIINFDYEKFLNDNDRANNISVMAGDTIVVP